MQTVTVEMAIGLRHYPGEYVESFNFVDGCIRRPKHVPRLALQALGNYQPHDIGKRVHGNQVENEEQITKRTGMNTERRKLLGRSAMREARTKYKGHQTIWGTIL